MTHQLFCNSCKFGQISSPYDIYCKEKNIAKYSPYYGRKLSQETIQFLQTCGCASHGDFQDQRGKVLGECLKAITVCPNQPCCVKIIKGLWKEGEHG
jgi:hypothetical protein